MMRLGFAGYYRYFIKIIFQLSVKNGSSEQAVVRERNIIPVMFFVIAVREERIFSSAGQQRRIGNHYICLRFENSCEKRRRMFFDEIVFIRFHPCINGINFILKNFKRIFFCGGSGKGVFPYF